MPRVACLDVWTPPVREIVLRTGPAAYDVAFAESADAAYQLDFIRDADVILVGAAPLSAEMIDAAPSLQMVQKWGIGYDKIDVEALRRKCVPMAITAGSNARPVAELAVALMLAVYRRVPYCNERVRRGEWPKAEMRESCFQIGGKTLGLIGFGNIGRMLAQLLSGFGAEVLYHDARAADPEVERRLNARRVPLAKLLAESDIVSLHAPLTPETANLIDAAAIATMKPGAILINTARGGLVDEAALYDGLTSGKLRGAGLDALVNEPSSPGHPLLSLEQVVFTPHAGGGVLDNVENVARHAFANIDRHFAGEPISSADLIVAGPERSPS